MMHDFNEIVNCIRQGSRIVILTHANMDGDAVGSSSALCHALIKMGKQAVILIEDDIPGHLCILNNSCFVKEMPFDADLAIAVDCSDESRIENRISYFKNAADTICVDHHLSSGKFAAHSVIDPDMAATGLLVFELIQALNVEFDRFIAENLYVAIATDTGRFKYLRTDAHVHSVIAQLYAYGIDQVKLCNAVFDTYPLSQIRAEGIATGNMKIFFGGKGIISYITQEEIKSVGATYDQTDTCIDRIRLVEGIEIAAFLKEKQPGTIKVSLRAKSYANVNRVARSIGGGGHEKASGATLNMDMDTALSLVQTEIERELARY